MKILVIKLGMHYTPLPKLKHAALGEVDSIANLFVKNDHEVTIVCDKYFDNSENISYLNIFDAKSYVNIVVDQHFDLLVVCNGLITDTIDDFNKMQYSSIEYIKCPVVFMYCDMALPLRQMNLQRDDIYCMTQGKNLEILWSDLVLSDDLYHFEFERMIYFPFHIFPVINNLEKRYINALSWNKLRYYDLMYGGGFREGRREDDMMKWYFNKPDLKVAMFGNITLDMFNNYGKHYPKFLSSVDYDKFTEKMSQSLATVIISDPLYKRYDSLTQRIYESAVAGNIIFIDELCDPKHRLFPKNDEYSKFLYISNEDDLSIRIQLLKTDYQFYKNLRAYMNNELLKNVSVTTFINTKLELFETEINNICK